jgi:hypothetical protein
LGGRDSGSLAFVRTRWHVVAARPVSDGIVLSPSRYVVPPRIGGIFCTREVSFWLAAGHRNWRRATAPVAVVTMSLSILDRRHLASLNRKLQLVKDFTAGVALGHHTGLYLGGPGGIGKSYTVERELTRLGVPYKLCNSAITGRALFDRLARYPDDVHLIEDVESLTSDRRALGVLRSALWGTRPGRDGRMERLITWSVRHAAEEVIFCGGIIMTSNRRLADLPEIDALKTRIACIDLHVSNAEIAALMRRISADGWPQGEPQLDPEQCREVAEFIIEEASRTNRRLDLRLLVNSFQDFLQYDDLEAGCDWKDLVTTRVRQRPSVAGDIEPHGIRAQAKAEQLRIAREVVGLRPEERLRVWRRRTGKSRATLYRRLDELASDDASLFGE